MPPPDPPIKAPTPLSLLTGQNLVWTTLFALNLLLYFVLFTSPIPSSPRGHPLPDCLPDAYNPSPSALDSRARHFTDPRVLSALRESHRDKWVHLVGDSTLRESFYELASLLRREGVLQPIEEGEAAKREATKHAKQERRIGSSKLTYAWRPFLRNATTEWQALLQAEFKPDLVVFSVGLHDLLYSPQPDIDASLKEFVGALQGTMAARGSRAPSVLFRSSPHIVDEALKGHRAEAKQFRSEGGAAAERADQRSAAAGTRPILVPHLRLRGRLPADGAAVRAAARGWAALAGAGRRVGPLTGRPVLLSLRHSPPRPHRRPADPVRLFPPPRLHHALRHALVQLHRLLEGWGGQQPQQHRPRLRIPAAGRWGGGGRGKGRAAQRRAGGGREEGAAASGRGQDARPQRRRLPLLPLPHGRAVRAGGVGAAVRAAAAGADPLLSLPHGRRPAPVVAADRGQGVHTRHVPVHLHRAGHLRVRQRHADTGEAAGHHPQQGPDRGVEGLDADPLRPLPLLRRQGQPPLRICTPH